MKVLDRRFAAAVVSLRTWPEPVETVERSTGQDLAVLVKSTVRRARLTGRRQSPGR